MNRPAPSPGGRLPRARAWPWAIGLVVLSLPGGPLPGAPAPGQPPPAAALPEVRLDSAAVVSHLDLLISWYHQVNAVNPLAGVPNGAVYQDSAQALAAEIVRLGFQSAKAEALFIGAQRKAGGVSMESAQQQNLAHTQARTMALIGQMEGGIAALDAQLARAPGARRAALASQRDDLQGQLDLQKALLDALGKMTAFLGSNSGAAGGLDGGIEERAKSIPEILGPAAAPRLPPAASAASGPTLAMSGGLISQGMALSDYLGAEHQMDAIIRETETARDLAAQVSLPLRAALRAIIQESQARAVHPPITEPGQLLADRQGFKDLTVRFKQLSSALLPLNQELVLLNDSRAKSSEWRAAIARASYQTLRSLFLRALGIVLALAAVLAGSEVWRRITFRYVPEPRRRRQFLVLRRVLTGFLVVIVLVLGMATEFSSLATFAGIITAGIAVGLQAVLLSVAAYFFIIGRYGLRVGDRVSIAGITGDVVDIGLIRLYLMELAGTGMESYPTGRLVVFSNAVLFQPSTPLYKQIPGTEYTWHEVVVPIAPGGDHGAAEAKLLAGVNRVCSPHRAEIERQHRANQSRIEIQLEAPHPEARLEFADAGLELRVRYPVELRNSAELDAQMTRSVLDLIATDPALKAAITGTPRIRSAIRT